MPKKTFLYLRQTVTFYPAELGGLRSIQEAIQRDMDIPPLGVRTIAFIAPFQNAAGDTGAIVVWEWAN
jgi:hypothetical protein